MPSRVGGSQVLLGSDAPFAIGDPDPVRTVRTADLTQAKQAVCGGNARRIMSHSTKPESARRRSR